MDEITVAGSTQISEIKDDEVRTYIVKPENFGMKTVSVEDIRGGDCDENAKITRAVLSGEKGPKRDIVLLNAGAAIYVAGLADSIPEGIKKAEESVDTGAAMKVLEDLIEISKKF